MWHDLVTNGIIRSGDVSLVSGLDGCRDNVPFHSLNKKSLFEEDKLCLGHIKTKVPNEVFKGKCPVGYWLWVQLPTHHKTP